MVLNSNYVLVDGIQTEDGRLIPIWSEEIICTKNRYNEACIALKSDPNNIYQRFIKLQYNIVTKEISLGEVIDIYPNYDNIIKIGDKIGIQVDSTGKLFSEGILTSIEYDGYSDFLCPGNKKLDEKEKEYIKKELDPSKAYILRYWKPIFICSNHKRTKFINDIIKLI